MIKTKKQSMIIVGVFVIALMLFTTTYAFFNYTRTGASNTIKTGRIAFNSSQGTAINLTDMFPIDTTVQGIMNDSTKVGTVTINVTGDTSYTEGLEYLVTAVNVQNTVGNRSLPISINVSVENNSNNNPATTLGTNSNDYYNDRGGDTSYYKVLANDTISTDDKLLVGYIAPGSDGVDGNIVIKAYLDKNKIAITDTYPEGDVTHTEGEEPNQEEVVDYTNGTTDLWVDERETFTTTEWNSLQANGVSFQVKVEANEGTWVPKQMQLATEVVRNANGVMNVADAYRYTGENVDNYVYFNCSDMENQDSTTCETWRIIGAYGDNLKIIKGESLGTQRKYNDSRSDGKIWSTSRLKEYLNQETEGGYYYSLTYTAKNMIVGGTWLAGETNTTDIASVSYQNAQATPLTNTKVGLIAAYEYLYASDISCHEIQGDYSNFFSSTNNCPSKDWLSFILGGSSNSWTLSPSASYNTVIQVITYGNLADGEIDYTAKVLPVVYLNSNVKIKDGTGEITSPYVLQ